MASINLNRYLKLGLLVLFFLTGCGNNGEFVQPEIKPLMEAVYASGFVIAENEYQVFSQVDGYVTDMLVSEGDPVKKGAVLYIIESAQQQARLRMARENYELAKINAGTNSPVLNELRAALKSAQTKKQFDSLNFIRYENLLKNSATSKADYDRAKLTYESSMNDFVLADSRFKKMAAQLKTELANAESQLMIARDESQRYKIKSLVDGVVFKTQKGVGELVKRTEPLAVIGSGEQFFLQLQVDELDIQRVRTGQEVLVKIDAFPGTFYRAEVNRIYPMVDSRQQSLRVDAELKEPLPGAYTGLALEANIIIQKKEKTLVIPKSALMTGDTVIIRTSNGSKKVKIQKGVSTFEEVEVLEGIQADSWVKVK